MFEKPPVEDFLADVVMDRCRVSVINDVIRQISVII